MGYRKFRKKIGRIRKIGGEIMKTVDKISLFLWGICVGVAIAYILIRIWAK